MTRRKFHIGAATCVLVAASCFVGSAQLTSGAAGATNGCKIGMFPVAESAASNLHAACVQDGSTSGNAIRIDDFQNAAWHDGASRQVKVSGIEGSPVFTVLKGDIGIAGTNNDINRSVEAGFNKLTPGSFVIGESGTGIGGTITLSQPAPKSRNYNLMIENGPGRGVSDAALNGSTTVTSATANFNSDDVGKSITGANIPVAATITAVNSATSITISSAATASASDVAINIAEATRNSTHRLVWDLTVNGSDIYSNQANFQSTDIGLLVKGKGIPANAYVATVASPSHATINLVAKKPRAGIVTTIGLQSATAAVKDGRDPVATLQTEITLNPSLVGGVPACSANFTSGTDITGVWNSPKKFALHATKKDPAFYFNDSFVGLKDTAQQPVPSGFLDPTRAVIGQIFFKTAAVDFAAYVQEAGPGGAVDIVFPFVPTGLGQCAGTAIASVFQFNADALSQNSAPTGYGKPGSAGFRHTLPLDAAGTSDTESASYTIWNASLASAMTVSEAAKSDVLTVTDTSGLTEGQVVTFNCGACANHFKANKAYYVHIMSGTEFQVSLLPFDDANGVPFAKPVKAKLDDSTESITWGHFTSVAGPFTDSCTVSRPAPISDDVGSYPCGL